MKLRLKLVEAPPYCGMKNDKRLRPGNCRGCGRRLTDKKSKQRGYGPECFEKYISIVFEFVPEQAEV